MLVSLIGSFAFVYIALTLGSIILDVAVKWLRD